MANNAKKTRPSIQDRLSIFLSLKDLNKLIELLERAYFETENEHVATAIAGLKRVKDEGMAQEESWRNEEITEFLINIDDYPHAVRTWML